MYRAVFLDRDNTIIQNDGDLGDPERVTLIQGTASAIASLRGLGYKVIVVTNQGGVARGKYSEADVEAVNRRINELVKKQSGAMIDRFYFCPYHPQAVVEQYKREHPWRKPQPGMLLQAAMDMNLDLRQCWTIGDQVRDVQAGKAASTRTVLLQDLSRAVQNPPEADHVVGTLAEAARIIAEKHRGSSDPAIQSEAGVIEAVAPVDLPAICDDSRGEGRATLGRSDAEVEVAPSRFEEMESGPEVEAIRSEADVESQSSQEQHQSSQPSKQEAPNLFNQNTPDPAPVEIPDIKPVEPFRRPAAPAQPPSAQQRAAATEPAGQESTTTPRDTQSQLLSQILRELKQRHVQQDDFSWVRLASVLLQTLAVGFVLIAMFNFRGQYYFDWLLLAVFVQLTVIASLLFARRSG